MIFKSKILLATTHWHNNSHHSNYSGYQRLALYLTTDFDVTLVTWGNEDIQLEENEIHIIILKSVGKTFFKKRILISNYCKINATKFQAVFLLYADIGIKLNFHTKYLSAVHNLSSIGKYTSLKEQIILWLKHKLIEPRVYRASKYIICVSSNIHQELKQKYPSKAKFIPHGIDVHFWKDQAILNKKILEFKTSFSKIAICVGVNGVNIQEVEKCIKALPEVLFFLVGAFDFKYPNVKIFKGISDEDLRDLYLVSDVFFRPLDFATANNSLLEAMSIGKKVVITNTGGVKDYISNEYAYLANQTNETFLEQLSQALNNINLPPKLEQLPMFTNKHYSWEVIAQKIASLF